MRTPMSNNLIPVRPQGPRAVEASKPLEAWGETADRPPRREPESDEEPSSDEKPKPKRGEGPERVALSVDEFASSIGVSPATAWRWIAAGKLKVVRAGHRTLVPVAARTALLATAK